MKVSIIIPVYNEFRTFERVLERVQAAPLFRKDARKKSS